ncbi:hypothetical protein AA106556_1929 [Neokomagataea tanensis NBRC 106556]|uniref:Uncharacterized protein n=1 Tax=Neokomagataea tanensis NBRC 106556 TaxID=1223519 RepID=A0ABQ0QL95_9PROT|nr:hypothetical protein AA106556_1929 [Neokomagataea tanensis NBRC 106556]
MVCTVPPTFFWGTIDGGNKEIWAPIQAYGIGRCLFEFNTLGLEEATVILQESIEFREEQCGHKFGCWVTGRHNNAFGAHGLMGAEPCEQGVLI